MRGLRPAPRRPVHRGPADPEQNLTLRPRDAGLASVFQTREGALAVLIESVASAALQLGAAALLCLIAWAIFGRRRWGLRAWLGLKAAPAGLVLIAAAAGAAGAALLLQAPGLAELASGPGTVIRAVVGEGRPGAVGLAALAVAALVKTALAEELLFRGLIARRLYAWTGFTVGNGLQAALFAAVHLPVLLLPQGRSPIGAAMIGFAFLMALAAGWLNERRAGGSILPGYGLHAGANLTTYLMLALA